MQYSSSQICLHINHEKLAKNIGYVIWTFLTMEFSQVSLCASTLCQHSSVVSINQSFMYEQKWKIFIIQEWHWAKQAIPQPHYRKDK